MGIQNCKFKFRCTQQWGLLERTEVSRIRYCVECESEVHRCETDKQLAAAVRNGLCVAIPNKVEDDVTFWVGSVA